MDQTSQLSFRKNLRTAMTLRHVSQRELASRLTIHYPHLNRILVGKSSPALPLCEQLADALGFELRELLLTPAQFAGLIPSNDFPK